MASNTNDDRDVKPTGPPSDISNNSSDITKKPGFSIGSSALSSMPPGATTNTSVDGSVGATVAKRVEDIKDMTPAAALPVSGLEVVKAAKPHARTAIGQVVQKLKSVPSLFSFEFEFLKETTQGWVHVESCKLRRKVAAQWLNTHMSDFRQHFSVAIGRDLGTACLRKRDADALS